MEVRIGVQNVVREIVLESAQTPQEVEKAVQDALTSEGVLSLVDEKGRRVVVPTSKLGYVDIAEAEQRRVGFGAS